MRLPQTHHAGQHLEQSALHAMHVSQPKNARMRQGGKHIRRGCLFENINVGYHCPQRLSGLVVDSECEDY